MKNIKVIKLGLLIGSIICGSVTLCSDCPDIQNEITQVSYDGPIQAEVVHELLDDLLNRISFLEQDNTALSNENEQLKGALIAERTNIDAAKKDDLAKVIAKYNVLLRMKDQTIRALQQEKQLLTENIEAHSACAGTIEE